MIGKKLAHYEITSMLGKGGMGEVYRAKDRKLGRDVAIKVLPEEFSKDSDRVSRFEREAKLLASLNHTNIAAIYGLEECGGMFALVMELAEGTTLADHISREPVKLEEALPIAQQIVEALEAAHERGIVHRDLKPANIKVLPDGTVKVLDFGLAKALENKIAEADGSNSPTLSMAATRAGIILGTAAYMAPEQARGTGVDRRCDIWSFGVVLFEMLAGKRLFDGETISDTLAAVLRADIDWNLLPKDTPANIAALLRRCLTRDRKQRLQAIGEARIAIAGYLANPVSAPEIAAEIPQIRFEISTPPTSQPTSIAISPDGRRLVFVGLAENREMLWLRPLDQIEAQPLMGTEGAFLPFWSPDSGSIGFFADGRLKRIDLAGGRPRTLTNATLGGGGTWNRDGIILYSPTALNPIYRIPASGGEPAAITQVKPPKQIGHCFPEFLPDGRRFLFVSWGSHLGIYLASLDSAEIRKLTTADIAAYAPPGYLLFIRQGTLFAQPFNPARGEIAGDMVQIADSVGFDNQARIGGFSLSETGVLAYRTSEGTGSRQLVWFDRTGRELKAVGKADDNNLRYPEISPDGRRVAVARTVERNTDVWLMETTRGVPSRFTFEAPMNVNPVWSPDGSRIAFGAIRGGISNLYQKASGGAGGDEVLLESSLNKFPLSWSPDGRFLLFVQLNPETGSDLCVLPLAGEKRPFPLANTVFDEDNGQFSPDGRWVAYQSNESGKNEIYVQSFPDPGSKLLVSTGGGIAPRWRPDGKELFYIAPDSTLMAVPMQSTGEVLKPGVPAALFQTRIALGGTSVRQKHQYAVAPKGRRFLINASTSEPTASPIVVVTNWSRSLKKKGS